MADMVQVRRSGGNSYREVPEARVGRSQFNRSHTIKTTFDASYLVPILVDEVLPGDTFTLRMNGFCRVFAPLKAPIMDNIEVETFFFFVPNRLVWSNWEKFMGAQDDPGDGIDYTIPIQASFTVAAGGLADYFGIPLGLQTGDVDINTLPFRAYGLIYNEWFRDQNLIDSEPVATDNGPDISTDAPRNLLKRAKKHDRFTSCLPWTQKGEAVSALFPVLGIGKENLTFATTNQNVYETGGEATTTQYAYSAEINPSTAATSFFIEGDAGDGPHIYADVDINSMRQAVAIQRLLEIDARGGTRYVETIKAHFGVTSPDFRLQRPEYLGGGRSFINISPVAQTAEGTTNPEVGTLAGVGAGSLTGGHGFAKSFTEHGIIIGLISARGDVTYQQGLDRFWSKSTRYDYYVPALANLGEDAVLNKELYVSNVAATDDAAFGYQERWYDYRTKLSQVTGKFRSDAAGTLDHWHLAQDFGALPTLNQTFIEDATPMDRITAVSGEPDFVLDAYMDYRCARPLPVYSIPSLTGLRF